IRVKASRQAGAHTRSTIRCSLVRLPPRPHCLEVDDMHAIQCRLARRSAALPAGRIALALALALAAAGAQADDAWQTSGDVRFGYVSSETRARGGATSDADSFRVRARLRVGGELGGGWRASGRVAARLDTEQSNDEFWLRTYAPGRS